MVLLQLGVTATRTHTPSLCQTEGRQNSAGMTRHVTEFLNRDNSVTVHIYTYGAHMISKEPIDRSAAIPPCLTPSLTLHVAGCRRYIVNLIGNDTTQRLGNNKRLRNNVGHWTYLASRNRLGLVVVGVAISLSSMEASDVF